MYYELSNMAHGTNISLQQKADFQNLKIFLNSRMDLIYLDFHGVGDKLFLIIIYC